MVHKTELVAVGSAHRGKGHVTTVRSGLGPPAEVFPSGEEGLRVHLRGLDELVGRDGQLEVELLLSAAVHEADREVRHAWNRRHAVLSGG